MALCGCRCIKCKNQHLESFRFVASDGFDDMHHTCLSCNTHFSHVDGETYDTCQTCHYFQSWNYPPFFSFNHMHLTLRDHQLSTWRTNHANILFYFFVDWYP